MQPRVDIVAEFVNKLTRYETPATVTMCNPGVFQVLKASHYRNLAQMPRLQNPTAIQLRPVLEGV